MMSFYPRLHHIFVDRLHDTVSGCILCLPRSYQGQLPKCFHFRKLSHWFPGNRLFKWQDQQSGHWQSWNQWLWHSKILLEERWSRRQSSFADSLGASCQTSISRILEELLRQHVWHRGLIALGCCGNRRRVWKRLLLRGQWSLLYRWNKEHCSLQVLLPTSQAGVLDQWVCRWGCSAQWIRRCVRFPLALGKFSKCRLWLHFPWFFEFFYFNYRWISIA